MESFHCFSSEPFSPDAALAVTPTALPEEAPAGYAPVTAYAYAVTPCLTPERAVLWRPTSGVLR